MSATTLPCGALKGLEGLPSGLLAGRKTAVLWDVENVKPWAPILSIPIQVHRIKVRYRGGGYFKQNSARQPWFLNLDTELTSDDD